jgi:Tfp pilus assembly protein PilE
MKHESRNMKQSGQILIFTFVFMMIVTVIVGALVSYANVQIRSHRQAVQREVGLDIAEAGAELAIWKLNNESGYTGENNTSYAAGVYTVTITNLSGSSKLIKVDSYVPNATSPIAHRTIQVNATTGTKNVGFNYGAQVDLGGMAMDNNSTVIGNVYSNGNLSDSGTVTGDAIVSGATGTIDGVAINGNATAHNIKNNTVGKDANGTALTSSTVNVNGSFASITSCTIKGTAKYNTRTSCTVNGTATTPNPSVPPDPAYLPLPIDAATITQWENDGAAGGTTSGNLTINSNQSLGPRKITGDLTINATLTVTGTLWVQGNITFGNNSIMQLSSSYGSLSGVVIAGTLGTTTKGVVDLGNNAQILGSGTTGSYLLMLSQNADHSGTAISVSNNVSGAIFYAGSGVIDVSNNAGAKEITGYKLHLNNNATITYESGLSNANFSSGGSSSGWQINDQTWQLLQ